ncbi:tyrosine-protein phosphatase non-receptor type substrate 1-like [Alligator sinensis]|uniref:Tyrosine-protein phosphatase non-receptor type substrate 1-like n=1 Tax=Alligator sinensis TaxID=38654 RepID=A0A3Q0H7D2_ALLSI|nr:tyrosine-protein phosphatase non-receptor type substrate 1-like [Alligator sinensis]
MGTSAPGPGWCVLVLVLLLDTCASPSAPSVSGPASRVEPGSPVNFTCTSKGLSPGDITVTWLKDGAKLPAQPLQILLENERDSYCVSSTLARTLTVGDIRSQLTCQIEHSTMSAPLRGLSQALRGEAPAGPDRALPSKKAGESAPPCTPIPAFTSTCSLSPGSLWGRVVVCKGVWCTALHPRDTPGAQHERLRLLQSPAETWRQVSALGCSPSAHTHTYNLPTVAQDELPCKGCFVPVSPRPRLTTNYSGAVPVNEMVAFTCSLVGFYPNVARLTWMENGNETGPEKSPSPTENPNGTFSLTRTLEVRATEQRNQSSFTCRAVHDSQPPASVTRVLAVTATSNKMEEDKKEAPGCFAALAACKLGGSLCPRGRMEHDGGAVVGSPAAPSTPGI